MSLGCVFWLNFSEPFRLAAVRILVLSFLVGAVGLIFRMPKGRPRVTNLYSSAVFVGWGAALPGLILELIYQTEDVLHFSLAVSLTLRQ